MEREAPVWLAGLGAVIFALLHVFGPGLRFLRVTPRSIWLSIAGGVSVAYVFVHLLPDLAEHQTTIARAAGRGTWLQELEAHSYLIALLGLATFYGLERLAQQSSGKPGGSECKTSAHVFWVHLSSFAVYNFLIGYLLLHREQPDARGLAFYIVAMGLHFLVNDNGLRQLHGDTYNKVGRWPLAAAPLAGFALGVATSVSPVLIAALFAFLAGGVILNVLKEELPEERESRFWAFALGTGAYSVLLLAT